MAEEGVQAGIAEGVPPRALDDLEEPAVSGCQHNGTAVPPLAQQQVAASLGATGAEPTPSGPEPEPEPVGRLNVDAVPAVDGDTSEPEPELGAATAKCAPGELRRASQPDPQPEGSATYERAVHLGRQDGLAQSIIAKPLEQREFDFFINHCQASGADQCGKLALLLRARGVRVWYDMSAADLTEQGMEEGVANSRNMLVFLSDGLMSRPFCQKEQRWGIQYSCNFVGVAEHDDRHGGGKNAEGVDLFTREKACAPEDLKHLFDQVEFEPFQRREHLVVPMVTQLCSRGGCACSSTVNSARALPLFSGGGAVALAPAAAASSQRTQCFWIVNRWKKLDGESRSGKMLGFNRLKGALLEATWGEGTGPGKVAWELFPAHEWDPNTGEPIAASSGASSASPRPRSSGGTLYYIVNRWRAQDMESRTGKMLGFNRLKGAFLEATWGKPGGDKVAWELFPADKWDPNTGRTVEEGTWNPERGSNGTAERPEQRQGQLFYIVNRWRSEEGGNGRLDLMLGFNKVKGAILEARWGKPGGDKVPWEFFPQTDWNPSTGERH
jgi:hypothetical protein